MIVEYIRYTVPTDKAAELVAAYQDGSASLRASPHCLEFELSQCRDDAGSFVLRIVWDSLSGHLEGFRRSPEFQPFLQAIGRFVPNITEMRHYELTSVNWSRA
ncbi:MAG TPA: antibiotic biosynthesis monooxygenase family protein [Polyangiaceae bacterium]|nr:antibiotic biosynthesis monooxygenase family protein [Polyangiaceae bacterium]